MQRKSLKILFEDASINFVKSNVLSLLHVASYLHVDHMQYILTLQCAHSTLHTWYTKSSAKIAFYDRRTMP
jgi:hypothetical protein